MRQEQSGARLTKYKASMLMLCIIIVNNYSFRSVNQLLENMIRFACACNIRYHLPTSAISINITCQNCVTSE